MDPNWKQNEESKRHLSLGSRRHIRGWLNPVFKCPLKYETADAHIFVMRGGSEAHKAKRTSKALQSKQIQNKDTVQYLIEE